MRNLIRSIYSFCVIAVLSAAAASGQSEQAASMLQPQDRKVLKRWLDTDRSKLRPATIDDLEDLSALSQARTEWGKDYYPYYRVGDFNRDRVDDFAVVLVDPTIKEKSRFSIAVFHGGNGENAAPALFEQGKDLSRSGLFESVGLVVMSLTKRDDCVIHLWDGKRYVAKNCVTPPDPD